ncbi:MAG: FIG01121376: hypothetical protein [uncultured Solirubrobacteraceae bacterium]|uniref:DUF2382 domain-containing protein n=1 Tax=uncultured Solirubrobacteraceae bacterium TaxID=1162706 RepID=A0A6J4RDZ3_9ACTN|nr:MAG: FIG01121376: hypothetical protein [uncultured Solirubrobacteraceae bacterium]
MSEFDIDTALKLRGSTVRDRDGEKVGTVGDVFLDSRTDRPAWVGVKTGLLGSKQSYVSLSTARVSGDELQLPYDKDLVRSAPHVEPDVALTAEEEQELYRHYGEPYHADETPDAELQGETATPTAGPDLQTAPNEMIRSEEEVRLGHSERRPVERVRIKKVTVTENQTQVVPVRREVIQLEHEPPPSGHIESVEDLPEGTSPAEQR